MRVVGHAGYAAEGRDIICAAVSTLIYTAIGSLEDLCGLSGFYRIREDEGSDVPEAVITVPEKETEKGMDGRTQWIMATIRKGCLLLEDTDRRDYGGRHVCVIQKEG